MEIRALVLINSRDDASEDQVLLTGPPLALLDVAGKSPLQRTVEHLEQYGVSGITAVLETSALHPPRRDMLPSQIDCRRASPGNFWRTCEDAFHELARNEGDLMLMIRLGAYAEIDFERLIQFHRDRSCRVSQVIHETHAPEVFCFRASPGNDAGALFRAGFSRRRSACPGFLHAGYVNPLRDARDLRQFAIDMLTLKTRARPAGAQAVPGIWIAPGAVVANRSRILAPAFIGTSARIGPGAVITRCATVECGARVDRGAIIENSTVLPHTYVGAGLDVAHSVVGMGQVANLRENTVTEIFDRNLLGAVPTGVTGLAAAAAGAVSAAAGRGWRVLRGESRALRKNSAAADADPHAIS